MKIVKSANYLSLRKRIDASRPVAGLFFSGWNEGFEVKDKLISENVYLGLMAEAANALIIASDGIKPSLRISFDDTILTIPISASVAGWLQSIINGEQSAINYTPEKYSNEAHLGLFLLLGLYLKNTGLILSIKQDGVHKNKNKALADSPNFKIFAGWLPSECENYNSAIIKFSDLWDKTTKRILSFAQICDKFPIQNDI